MAGSSDVRSAWLDFLYRRSRCGRMRCEGRKTLARKVARRASRAGEGVGWKTGRGPGGEEIVSG